MAKRFGGKFSPAGPGTGEPARAVQTSGQPKAAGPVGLRANLLFFAPTPFVFVAFGSNPTGLALNLLAFGTLVLAAWMTREGILAQMAYEARRVARRPAIPRKIFGAVLTGAGLFLGGLAHGGGIVNPVIFAVLGTAMHAFSFGPDPLKDKGMEGIDQFQSDRVARAVTEAEKHLTAMKDAILRANDRKLEARVDRFCATARQMFRTVENDPRDLTAARKYLGVYLMGARDATIKFADLHAHDRDRTARADYEALLDDLETNFAARTDALLNDDRTDLDIEIEVLRERLQRDGPRPPT